jgi:hypothetical protein
LSKPLFDHRLTVNVTPDMDRYLEDLARTRTRQGKPVSKADLIREAIRHYMDNQDDLTGSRKQIARSLEGKIQQLAQTIEGLSGEVRQLTASNQAQHVANRELFLQQGKRLDDWRQGLERLISEIKTWRPQRKS